MSPRKIATNCSVVTCPAPATYRGRCDKHAKQQTSEDNQRYGTKYDTAHVKLRAQYQRRMDKGETFTCWRCEADGRPHIVDPANWDLGHDNGKHRGPECVRGNRGAPRKGA